jgi:hypothetical protein
MGDVHRRPVGSHNTDWWGFKQNFIGHLSGVSLDRVVQRAEPVRRLDTRP